MHAVVLNVTVNDPDAATAALRDEVVPQVSGTPGFVAGYWVRLEGGRGTSVVVFESEDAARSAAVSSACAISGRSVTPMLGSSSAAPR